MFTSPSRPGETGGARHAITAGRADGMLGRMAGRDGRRERHRVAAASPGGRPLAARRLGDRRGHRIGPRRAGRTPDRPGDPPRRGASPGTAVRPRPAGRRGAGHPRAGPRRPHPRAGGAGELGPLAARRAPARRGAALGAPSAVAWCCGTSWRTFAAATTPAICSSSWRVRCTGPTPLVWRAAHRARLEQEQACDDRVLGLGTASVEYAQHLLDIARTFAAVPARGALAMAASATLPERMRAILDLGLDHRPAGRRTLAGVAAVAAVFALPTAALRPWSDARREAQLTAQLASPSAALRRDAAWSLGALGIAHARAARSCGALRDPRPGRPRRRRLGARQAGRPGRRPGPGRRAARSGRERPRDGGAGAG